MKKKIYLRNISLLKKDREFIYKVCSFFNSDDGGELFISVINTSCKNIWKLKYKDDYLNWIEDITIYAIINNLGVDKIKNVLSENKLIKDENVNEEQLLFNLLKNNILKIQTLSNITIPDNLEDIIDATIKNNKKKKKRMILTIMGASIITIPIILFTFIPHLAYKYTPLGPKFNTLHNLLFLNNIKGDNSKYENAVVISGLPIDRDSTLDFVHCLSNDLIIAQNGNAKWGVKEVTPENINIAIKSVREYMYNSFLIEMLNKWAEGNFDNATIVHNYIWNILEGNVGYAVAIDESRVNSIINKYFND